jgi:hypothetical protein
MGTTDTPDQRVAALAAEQHGVITLAQALALGMTEGQVRHRVSAGRWIRAALGVYVVAGTPSTWEQATTVACLAAPNGAVASHSSAAALYRLLDPPETPEVTVPKGSSSRFRGAVVRRSMVADADVTAIGPIPVTTAARTVVDCAALLPYEELCELLDDALCERLCTTREIAEAMERSTHAPGRPGLASLERALLPWTPGLMPGSRAEMRLIRRLLAWGFPPPERQVKVFDADGRFLARLDVAWRDRNTGLEYYGERHHGPRQVAHDERRLGRVRAVGWSARVVRKADLSGRRAEELRRWLSARLT